MTDSTLTPCTAGECTALGRRCNHALDRVVLSAAEWSNVNRIDPHRASWGAAVVLLPAVAAVASWGWVAPAALVASLAAYLRIYMPAKRKIIRGARRKLLIDLTVFVAPTFLGLCALGGLSLGLAADVLAFVVITGIAVLRGGCFFAGCCRGRPARVGARYPGVAGRFVPLPLFEIMAACVMLPAAIGLSVFAVAPGSVLTPLAGAYAGYRFFSEFFRARTGPFAVRRWFGLSLTQWLCAGLLGVLALRLVS